MLGMLQILSSIAIVLLLCSDPCRGSCASSRSRSAAWTLGNVAASSMAPKTCPRHAVKSVGLVIMSIYMHIDVYISRLVPYGGCYRRSRDVIRAW